MKKSDKLFLTVGLIAIISATGVGGYALINSSKNNINTTVQSTKTSTNTTTDSTVDAVTTTASNYKDGVYSATANYSVPHGYQNSIDVSITVKDGLITAASSRHTYSDSESGMYIDSFDSSLNASVVGKYLDGASFSRIGGASITTVGFQQALESVISAASI